MSQAKRLLPLLFAALATVAFALPAPASPLPVASAPAGSGVGFIDPLYDCNGVGGVGEPVPESVSVNGVTDNGRTVNLDVLVFLDVAEGASIAKEKDPAVKAARMAALEEKMVKRIQAGRRAYNPLDINYRFVNFRLLSPLAADGTPRDRTSRATSIINLTKNALDGKRPANVDVVYTLTDLDIWEPVYEEQIAGLADCIGGVRYASRAFAVGEISGTENIPVGPLTFYRHATAKIMAHEIGHLLGAHHHYQDCATGAAEGYDDDDYVTPCSVMTNAVDLQSLSFSPLEGAVVRGHALDHAFANDELEAGQ